MSFWELLALMSAMATILGVWLAVYAIINNKTLKTETQLVRESLKEESRLTREVLDRMDAHIANNLASIADLIERGFRDVIADNAQTRSLIKTT